MTASAIDRAVMSVAPDDAEKAVATITLAFAADPAARWSSPTPEIFLAAFPQIVRAFGGAAFPLGAAYEAGGFGGAALWLPPGAEPDEAAFVAILEASAPPAIMGDIMAVFEQMETFHPKEPCWFLPLIGVDPARQGQGLGGALLAHGLARVDADGLPAYLESSNPSNVPFYERYGFEVVGVIQAGSSPPITPMLRPAR